MGDVLNGGKRVSAYVEKESPVAHLVPLPVRREDGLGTPHSVLCAKVFASPGESSQILIFASPVPDKPL